MIKDMTFGNLFREMRIRNKETLRQYCLKRGLDPGNISKMERNLMPPPSSIRTLDNYLADFSFSAIDYEFLVAAAQNFHVAMVIKKLQPNIKRAIKDLRT